MVEASKEVEVIPWQEEYQIADKNPEVIDTIDFYEMMLKQGLINEEKFRKIIDNVISGYASRTEGIAFIENKTVSFRKETPDFSVVLHELGHVYFQEPDVVWSAAYGGGELLMWLGLKKQYFIDEDCIRIYHALIHDAFSRPIQVAKEISERIVTKLALNCYPCLFAIELMGGTLPEDIHQKLQGKKLEDIMFELSDPRWKKLNKEVSSHDVFHFLQNLTAGLQYKDPFYMNYAITLNIAKQCPYCKKYICVCK